MLAERLEAASTGCNLTTHLQEQLCQTEEEAVLRWLCSRGVGILQDSLSERSAKVQRLQDGIRIARVAEVFQSKIAFTVW